jgi:hypothetical protein
MTNKLEKGALQADLSSVNSLLKMAKEVGDIIGEFQLSKRKKFLEDEITRILEEPDKSASVALFFGGKPVYGSRGISTDFAGHVLETFQELISKTYAIKERGSMGKRGPVPLEKSNQLMITEITRGSFGFILDELDNQNDMFDTGLKLIVEEITSLIERTASSNDIEFEEAIEKIDKRTFDTLKDFFKTLDSHGATIRIVEDKFDFILDEISINRAKQRTDTTDIDENDEFFTGVLTGFLPNHQKFEAKSNEGKDIYGSVEKEAVEQYTNLLSTRDKVIGHRWKLKIQQRIVKQLNRPQREVFRLLEFVETESDAKT